MNLKELTLEVVKRVNETFVLETKNPKAANEILTRIIMIFVLISDRHPEEFKRLLKIFNCIDYDFEDSERVTGKLEKLLGLRKRTNNYAAVQTNKFFKQNWKNICERFLVKDYSRCGRKGLDSLKIIYNFLCDCSTVYDANYNKMLHLETCSKFCSRLDGFKTSLSILRFDEKDNLKLGTKSSRNPDKRSIVMIAGVETV